MSASRNTFKSLQTHKLTSSKPFYVAGYTPGPLLLACKKAIRSCTRFIRESPKLAICPTSSSSSSYFQSKTPRYKATSGQHSLRKDAIANRGIGDTYYDHSLQLHYRQFLVALLFADLPSLSPFISCSTNISWL